MTYKDYYEILDWVKDVDPAGARSSADAVSERTKAGRAYGMSEKEVASFCRLARRIYQAHGSSVFPRERGGENIVDLLKEVVAGLKPNALNGPATVAGYLFWENEYARKAVPGKKLVKYTRERLDEIMNSFN